MSLEQRFPKLHNNPFSTPKQSEYMALGEGLIQTRYIYDSGSFTPVGFYAENGPSVLKKDSGSRYEAIVTRLMDPPAEIGGLYVELSGSWRGARSNAHLGAAELKAFQEQGINITETMHLGSSVSIDTNTRFLATSLDKRVDSQVDCIFKYLLTQEQANLPTQIFLGGYSLGGLEAVLLASKLQEKLQVVENLKNISIAGLILIQPGGLVNQKLTSFLPSGLNLMKDHVKALFSPGQKSAGIRVPQIFEDEEEELKRINKELDEGINVKENTRVRNEMLANLIDYYLQGVDMKRENILVHLRAIFATVLSKVGSVHRLLPKSVTHNISLPVAVIVGDQDTLFPADLYTNKLLEEIFPKAPLRILQKNNHWPHWGHVISPVESAKTIATCINNFLR